MAYLIILTITDSNLLPAYTRTFCCGFVSNSVPVIVEQKHQSHAYMRGWHSGESTRLPPMWPGSIPGPCVMWVEFVVGSCPCPEVFQVLRLFLPAPKPTFTNSNSIWNLRATGLLVEDCLDNPH